MSDNFIRLNPNTKCNEKADLNAYSKKKPSTNKNKNKITSIQTQKQKGRYNIFLDGEYAFPVDENILIKYLLRKGIELTDQTIDQIKKEDLYFKAYGRALNYLSYKMRSEHEIRTDLIDKNYSEQADEVIERLKDQAYVDDLAYAKSYFRTQALVNYKGPKNIEHELTEKKISPNNILQAAEEYPTDQQIDNALHLIRKKVKSIKGKSQKETMNKIKLFLVQKGYPVSIVDQALALYDFHMDQEIEYKNLHQQGCKALKRYQRKYEGYELVQRLKAFLFNKGFQSDLIIQFIEEEVE